MITIRRTLMAALVAAMASPAAIAAPGEPWYLNTTNWAFLTLVIFLLIVWRLGAFKMLTGALDSRAEGIQRELNYAQELRDEASVMLREAERKQQEASETADEIIRQAETDAKAMMAQAEKDLAAMVARREAQVEARIQRAEDEALRSVKRIAADAATKAAADIIKSNADKNGGNAEFSSAIGQVKSAL
ncbi:MAG: ATP F0F1 synthase subunit B [Ponticaulis sp.]|nr:ATP F0F1 synthase subunit B [Ponticaulis sp.]|tara:strand:- start:61432 stop:61998 length:567 start_codon:yes stop_codon:yes gene_type:complete